MGYPSFNTGDVLTAADMNAVGLWLVKSQTVGTGVSSVTVTDAFNANFENYKIIWSGGTMSAANDLQFYFGSTPSANSYYFTQWYQAYDGTFGSNQGNNVGQWTYVGGGDTNGAFMNMEVFQPFAAKRKFMTANLYTATRYTAYSTGTFASTSSFTSFTLDPVGSTTMTGGTIRVYGYRN